MTFQSGKYYLCVKYEKRPLKNKTKGNQFLSTVFPSLSGDECLSYDNFGRNLGIGYNSSYYIDIGYNLVKYGLFYEGNVYECPYDGILKDEGGMMFAFPLEYDGLIYEFEEVDMDMSDVEEKLNILSSKRCIFTLCPKKRLEDGAILYMFEIIVRGKKGFGKATCFGCDKNQLIEESYTRAVINLMKKSYVFKALKKEYYLR